MVANNQTQGLRRMAVLAVLSLTSIPSAGPAQASVRPLPVPVAEFSLGLTALPGLQGTSLQGTGAGTGAEVQGAGQVEVHSSLAGVEAGPLLAQPSEAEVSEDLQVLPSMEVLQGIAVQTGKERGTDRADPGAAFDGKHAPGSLGESILVQASERGLSARQLGETIQRSGSLAQAGRELKVLGFSAATDLRFPLQRVWWEVSPEVPNRLGIDDSWKVPSWVAQRDGMIFHFHGVVHGFKGMPGAVRGRQVRALVADLKARGLPLYSEEGLAGHFGYRYGSEVTDLGARRGLPVVVREVLARGGSSWVFAPLDFAILPFYRGFFHALGWLARMEGDVDQSGHWHRLAQTVFGPVWSLPEIRRLQLPMPLSVHDAEARQSKALAEEVLRDASAKGHREVHILTGYNHGRQAGEYLSE